MVVPATVRGWACLSRSGGGHEPLVSGWSSIWCCPHVRAPPGPAVALSHRGGGQPAGTGRAANPGNGVSIETRVAGWRSRPGFSTRPRQEGARAGAAPTSPENGRTALPQGPPSRAGAPAVVSENRLEIADEPDLSDDHHWRLLSSRRNVVQARTPGREISWTKLLPAPPPRPSFGLRGGRRSQGQSLLEVPAAQPRRQSSPRQR